MAGVSTPGEAFGDIDTLAARVAARLNRILDILDTPKDEPLVEEWRMLAACAFSYNPGIKSEDTTMIEHRDAIARLRRWCAECPVTRECLQYARDNRIQDGIWGGLSWGQRKQRR